jgi:hypothetical protein
MANRIIHKSQDQTQALWCLDWSVGPQQGMILRMIAQERKGENAIQNRSMHINWVLRFQIQWSWMKG